ncbi:hypothetical protein [Actinocatenispora rupis]|uniref:Uncharacterized protein n=1 Tax=Actinocatenispora rupis TaxID=519421 RepID=A0A8J3JBX4_9ACTN|nr:hypothetical protein [Actinocatenispora rupis]GID11988.1 hypothetical protein Aru02nite_28770 [Actinocatenispora rupis]
MTLARWLRTLAALLLAAVGVLALPGPAGAVTSSDRVIVVGVPGLRWDDVTAADTPALWGLAAHGSVGTLTARSTQSLTCADDGWLTLGAGNRAQRGPHRLVSGDCPRTRVGLAVHGDGSAVLGDQPAVVLRNQPARSRPGALAEALRCTTAIGPGAAIAAARPVGRINQYLPRPPADLRPAFDRCPLTVVDAGTVAGPDRTAQARDADRVLAEVLADRPEHSTVLVVGVADTDAPARLHVAVADGPGFADGWLSSGTTHRTGYVQLSDVAPTVTAALGLPRPVSFAGQAWQRSTDRGQPLAAARQRMIGADQLSVTTARNSGRFVAVLVAVQFALYLLAGVALVRLARRPATDGPSRRIRPAVETGASAAALMVPAMLLADLVPWWRAPRPGLVLVLVVAAVVVTLTAAVRLGPWRRHRLGCTAATAAVVVLVIGADALTGAHLELDNVVGYAAVTGDRYTGLGMVGLGAFAAAILGLAGCAARGMTRRYRSVAVALLGAIGVVIVGSPYLGADPGAAVAMTAGVAVAAVLAGGGWLTLTRLGWAVVTGVVVAGAFALLDLTRPADQRGHLGRFLANLFGGTARPALSRVAEANTVATLTSLLTVLVVVVALFTALVLLSPAGGLRRVYGLFPSLRGALVGTAVAGVLAGLFDGAGLIVAGAAASVAVPLAIQYCLQVVRPRTD